MVYRFWGIAIITVLGVVFAIGFAGTVCAEDKATIIDVELGESFYKALRSEGTRTYSSDKSEEYLRQIAVSARFAVETNLKILQQQARMVELLEAIKSKNR
jgi:hypothetical protein